MLDFGVWVERCDGTGTYAGAVREARKAKEVRSVNCMLAVEECWLV